MHYTYFNTFSKARPTLSAVFLTIILLAASVTSCKKEDPTPPTTPNLDSVILDPATHIIDLSVNNGYLLSVSSSSLTFKAGSASIDTLNTGDILVASPSNNAPRGYFERIVSVQKVGTQVVFQTEPASFEEAIIQCNFRDSLPITADDIESIDSMSGEVKDRGKLIQKDFDEVVFDLDGDEATTFDQVNLSGVFSIGAGIDIWAQIDNKKLRIAWIEAYGDVHFDLVAKAGGTFLKFEKEKRIAKFNIKSFVVNIGPMPVVLTPRISLYAGVEGEISWKLETSVSYDAHIRANVTYAPNQQHQWTSDFQKGQDFTFTPPDVTIKGEFYPYLRPAFSILVYKQDLTKAELYTRVGLKFESEISLFSNTDTASLSACVDAGAKVDFDFLSKNVFTYEKEFFSECGKLWGWSGKIDLTTGLIAYYPLDGSAEDASGNGRHGLPVASPTPALNRKNETGKAVEMNGLGSAIWLVGGGSANIYQDFSPHNLTIAFWINNNPGSTGWVLRNRYYGYVAKVEAGAMGLGCWIGGGDLGTSIPLPDEEWHHIAMTFSGTSLKYYIDGQVFREDGPFPVGSFIRYEEDAVAIGRDANGFNQCFLGKLDELRLYDRALSQSEILALAQM